ncbi:hypothetical protein [Paenarthrobacter sp. NCHU4564]|uniref:hypothetical protein n=1 Tax=Paenarthrobacter sp. NCHU4564 TaxID=3451353 RepID=UPI003F9DE042
MNQLSPGPHDAHQAGQDTKAGKATNGSTSNPTAAPAANPGKYDAVAGPFTVRDLTVFGSALLMFVASLLPMFGGRFNLWNVGNLFFLLLGILLPLTVVALFAARRLQPKTHVRIGSLSVDQFASVTAAFAFLLFFLTTAVSFNGSVLLGLVGSVGLLAATVLGPHLPFLSADFKGRADEPAHVVARQAVQPTRKPPAPKTPKPAAGKVGENAAPVSTGLGASAGFGTPAGAAAPAGTGAPAVVHSADATSASPQEADARQGAPAAPTPQPAAPAGAGGSAGNIGTAANPPVAQEPRAPQPVAEQAPHAGASPAAAGATQAAASRDASGTPREEAPAAADAATTQHAQQPAAQQPAQQGTERPWAATMATPIVHGGPRSHESIGATVDPASRPDDSSPAPAYEAFWFAVAQPRTAYDERTGAPAFVIEPGGWVLALEDRGHEFLVQDTDGKIGVLRELSNIERG